MLSLSAILSLGFSVVVPVGNAASYERVSAAFTASGRTRSPDELRLAVKRTFICLNAFNDIQASDFDLCANGLILPPDLGWRGKENSHLTLHNGEAASLSGLSLSKGESAVFDLFTTAPLEGGFEICSSNGEPIVLNNSGFDLRDCLLVHSKRAQEIGTFKFGASLHPGIPEGESLQEALRTQHDMTTRSGRMLVDFVETILQAWTQPDRTYVIGWGQSPEPLPAGYAQAADLGTLWVIELREGG
jgi:hypothetical protein